ncbi:MAG: EAL domain-containing protein [Pseudomonadota bacterium]
MEHPDAILVSKLITDHVADGILLMDPDGLTVWVNPAFCKMTGYSIEDLTGQSPWSVLQSVEVGQDERGKLAMAIERHEACSIEIPGHRKDGTPTLSQVNLSPIFNDMSELTHFVAVQRDVTEHNADKEARIDFDAYRRALDLQAIVSVTDERGRIRYVNDKFCKISGYNAEELLGENHRKVNSGTHEPGFFHEMWRTIRRGQVWHGEVCNRKKTGELYWVDTSIVPVLGPRGEILRYVSIRYDITERKAADTALRALGETDALTGLANRARYQQDLIAALAGAQADAGKDGLVVMVDIDHFKDVNDTLGHHSGDLLIKEVGRRLREHAGASATAARIGGDEFAVIIPRSAFRGSALATVQNLHTATSQAVALDGSVHIPSLSMGVTTYPTDAQTVEGVMINADLALYEAKRHGRNRFREFDPSFRERLEQRETLKGILLSAIENDSFEIALQPICCANTGAHRGFEVLARLSHNGRPISPGHFVPLAEELGLIQPIGRIVLRKGMAAHSRALDLGLEPGTLSINAAAPELRELGYTEDFQDLLLQHGLSPEMLVVEITETALIGRSTDLVAATLSRFREIGVRIALDDFGTGFSSLSHLRDFHVHRIKIDKSFVQDLEVDEGARSLVDALIGLAARLGLEVVAEGVETETQFGYLRDYGCNYAQGFLFAPPLTVDQALRHLKAKPTRDAAQG